MGQKAAWFVLQRLRHTMNETFTGKMDGTIQIDECYIGGKPQNMHESKQSPDWAARPQDRSDGIA